MRRILALVCVSSLGCAATPATEDSAESTNQEEAFTAQSDGTAWYHLDATNGLHDATLSPVNSNAKVKCGDGKMRTSCHVDTLVLPADCDWECQDGLLSLQGETVLRGKFSGTKFIASQGFDTYAAGLGKYAVFRITASATCAQDPCPTGMKAQQLNSSASAKSVASIDFSKSFDPNYVLDPARGYAQAASDAGLLVSGYLSSGVFHADRVWRSWTPKPACDVDQTARNYALVGGDGITTIELLTVADAERYTDPNGNSVHWLVRTAENATTVTFTSGINDLWAQKFDITKSTCALTVTAEH